jgi:hypothetical protein
LVGCFEDHPEDANNRAKDGKFGELGVTSFVTENISIPLHVVIFYVFFVTSVQDDCIKRNTENRKVTSLSLFIPIGTC